MTETIVVGVDGSAPAHAALQWAVEEARLRKARVKAVHCWEVPAVVMAGPYVPPGVDIAQFELDAKKILADEVASMAEDVIVEPVLLFGPAAALVVSVAAEVDASMLVVGERGRGELAGLLLGSESRYCAHHAACPVVIVPTPAG